MIYFIQYGEGGPIKIGTTTNLYRRMREHSRNRGERPLLWGVMDGSIIKEEELHRRFDCIRLKGESELFEATPELMDFIRTQCRPFPPEEIPHSIPRSRLGNIHIKLSAEVYEELLNLGIDMGMDVASLAKLAIVEYIKQMGNKKEIG